MWIILGRRAHTERVPGGRTEEGTCHACGEKTTFYERRVKDTFHVYFLDVVDLEKRTVMACGACGELYATEDTGSTVKPAGVFAEIGSAAQRALEGAKPALDQAAAAIGRAAAAAGPSLGELGKSAARGMQRLTGREERVRVEDEDEPEPIDDEKAKLLARFAELEKKMKDR